MADTYAAILRDPNGTPIESIKLLAGPIPRAGELLELIGGTRNHLIYRYRVETVIYRSLDTHSPALLRAEVHALLCNTMEREESK